MRVFAWTGIGESGGAGVGVCDDQCVMVPICCQGWVMAEAFQCNSVSALGETAAD